MAAVAREHKFGTAAIVIVLLILAGAAAYGIHAFLSRPASIPFQNFTVTQVPNSSDAVAAAISPDGKFLLSIRKQDNLESMWLSDITTGADTQIVPPAQADYGGAWFSPDGHYLYFRRRVSGVYYVLFRAPLFGGTPQPIVQDVGSNITFSPHGDRIAFARGIPQKNEFQLISAAADGTDEEVLYTGPWSERGSVLAWSPDGRHLAWFVALAYMSGGKAKNVGDVHMFDLASRKATAFVTLQRDYIRGLHWMPDGSGLLVVYTTEGRPRQIGFLSYPSAKFSPITRDTNGYPFFSITSNGQTLAALQTNIHRSLEVLTSSGAEKTGSSPLEQDQTGAGFGFAWDASGNLLFPEDGSLVRIASDGSSRTSLLQDPGSVIGWVSTCNSSHSIVFVWNNHAGAIVGLWRANADGTNLALLTSTEVGVDQQCSPDGKWVYMYNVRGDRSLSRISSQGGAAEPVPVPVIKNGFFQSGVAFSPDGKLMAFRIEVVNPATETRVYEIAILPVDSSQLVRMLKIAPLVSGEPVFTPDGKSVAYIAQQDGVDNIWVQPLDGSAPRQLTRFPSGSIVEFAWSPDGKQLAVERQQTSSGVVLFRQSSPASQ